MAIALAVLSSVFIGSGEFAASRGARRVHAAQMTLMFFITGLVVVVVVAPFFGGEPTLEDMAKGVGAGVFNGLGLSLLYSAYRATSVGVALPISGVIQAALPVAIALVIESRSLAAIGWVGVVIGCGAVAMSSLEPGARRLALRGAVLAAASGVSFGLTVTFVGTLSEDSGLWPAVPQRATALLVVAIIAKVMAPRLLPERGQRRFGVWAGVLGTLGLLCFVLAAQRGSLAAVSVLGAQYAAVSSTLAFVLAHERLRWWQTLGVAASGVSVALIALA